MHIYLFSPSVSLSMMDGVHFHTFFLKGLNYFLIKLNKSSLYTYAVFYTHPSTVVYLGSLLILLL